MALKSQRENSGEESPSLPRAFIMRRLHSFLGLWLVVYLCEHLLVNSQAALFFEDDGYGFISMVNTIHNLPYLPLIEMVILGIPFLIHMIWGVFYLKTAKYNAHPTDGSAPALPQYKRNKAYSWQRITSWILLFGIVAHVIHMRFVEYPSIISQGPNRDYVVRVKTDNGLFGVADRLGLPLVGAESLSEKEVKLAEKETKLKSLSSENDAPAYFALKDEVQEEEQWLKAAKKKPLREGEILAVAPNAGTAFLLIVRDTFKNPVMVVLYSLLVITSVYHAFNGLWTAMITWGVTLTQSSQRSMRHFSTFLMVVFGFFGVFAAVGTYILNLLQVRG